MKEFKGTPGPWFAAGTVIESDGLFIAEVIGDCTSREQDEYNATLMAAAPELLQALEALIIFTKPNKSNSVALNNAYQAIAKVLGETK